MELRLRPTEQFFMAGDVMVRMWQGTATRDDGAGEDVVALVAAVAFPGQASAIAEALVSIPPPGPAEARRWADAVLAGQEIEDPEG